MKNPIPTLTMTTADQRLVLTVRLALYSCNNAGLLGAFVTWPRTSESLLKRQLQIIDRTCAVLARLCCVTVTNWRGCVIRCSGHVSIQPSVEIEESPPTRAWMTGSRL